MQILCTYPTGIEYAGKDLIQVRNCAHILQKLNMQAHHYHFPTHILWELNMYEKVEIGIETK